MQTMGWSLVILLCNKLDFFLSEKQTIFVNELCKMLISGHLVCRNNFHMESIHHEGGATFHIEPSLFSISGKKSSFKEVIYLWKMCVPAIYVKRNVFYE